MLQTKIAEQGIAQNKSDGDVVDTVASLIDQCAALDRAASDVSGVCDDSLIDEIDQHRTVALRKLIATPFASVNDSQRAVEYLIQALEESICPGEEPCLLDRVEMHLLHGLLATVSRLEQTSDLPLIRLKHLVSELHARGPRVLFEWVLEGWDQPLSTFMARLEKFATIDRGDLQMTGGDRFPPALAPIDGGLTETSTGR